MGNLRYVLIVGDRMFAKSNFVTDRPKPKQSFRVLEKMIFICKNENIVPKIGEPVIAEIDASKHAPLSNCIELLLANGFTELIPDEVKEFKLHYLHTSKPKGVSVEFDLEKRVLVH